MTRAERVDRAARGERIGNEPRRRIDVRPLDGKEAPDDGLGGREVAAAGRHRGGLGWHGGRHGRHPIRSSAVIVGVP